MACGLALIRRSPAGASARERVDERTVGFEQLLGPVAAQPLLELRQVRRVVAHLGQRHLVRAPGALDGAPSTTFGPVQPFGVRSTIIGQTGRRGSPPLRAAR